MYARIVVDAGTGGRDEYTVRVPSVAVTSEYEAMATGIDPVSSFTLSEVVPRVHPCDTSHGELSSSVQVNFSEVVRPVETQNAVCTPPRKFYPLKTPV